ncbi:LOW QUALITY PROTEIN: glycine betaine ABC transport system, ATP-binding protein OpuAA [Geomicrobium sp. JCM 19039]|nr:LOW QUALITY PROTEIN: glycine betaine ABC transport system, ATP-binding protein OpuAA [Geomicrobium sp. JCM 19039]
MDALSKIKVENLTKVFGKKPARAIPLLNESKSKSEILEKTGLTVGVNKASFAVEDGEIFVIMGLSGSGKSTLVRLLNRLIEPTEGSVYLNDKDLAKVDQKTLRDIRRKDMSMVFQKFGLFPFRTIVSNVEYGLEVQGVPKDDRYKKAMESLKLVGLEGYEDKYPDELSGGMQQRVGLARAFANDSDVLLMDEAFSALDPLIRKDMQDELLDLQETMKKTIIFITHDLDEALRIGDRITIMKDAAIVQIGTPEEILTNPADEYVEKFVEDVDRSKVYTASNVMMRPETVQPEREGPRVALKRMRETGISSIFAVKRNRELIGIVDAADVRKLVDEGKDDLTEAIQTNALKVIEMDMPVNDVIDLTSETKYPIAVVDDGKLRGIIIRSSILAALSGKEVNLDE